MKKTKLSHLVRALFVYLLSACAMAASPALPLEGTIGETLNADRYTYLRVDNADGSFWVATTPVNIPIGASVNVPDGIVMKDFESAALGRTFDQVLFAERIESTGATGMTADSTSLPAGHPPVGGKHEAECPVNPDQTVSAEGISGEIIETMDAGNYTYIHVQGADKTVWAATEKFDARVGDTVIVPEGMLMKNFTSPTLEKTFSEIYFVDQVFPADGKKHDHAADVHAEVQKYQTDADPAADKPIKKKLPGDDGVITPPEGGLTVAELHSRRKELHGQIVTVRGKVTKVSENIMGKNWVHMKDGTGEGATSDLTITSTGTFRPGLVFTVKGRVDSDVKMGTNYRLPLILQDAEKIMD
jgi:GW (Gly-Tryp) dipeptide domain